MNLKEIGERGYKIKEARKTYFRGEVTEYMILALGGYTYMTWTIGSSGLFCEPVKMNFLAGKK